MLLIRLIANVIPDFTATGLSVAPAKSVIFMQSHRISVVAEEIRIQYLAIANQDITEMAYIAVHAAFAIQTQLQPQFAQAVVCQTQLCAAVMPASMEMDCFVQHARSVTGMPQHQIRVCRERLKTWLTAAAMLDSLAMESFVFLA